MPLKMQIWMLCLNASNGGEDLLSPYEENGQGIMDRLTNLYGSDEE